MVNSFWITYGITGNSELSLQSLNQFGIGFTAVSVSVETHFAFRPTIGKNCIITAVTERTMSGSASVAVVSSGQHRLHG